MLAGGEHVLLELSGRRAMLGVELEQLAEDVVPFLAAGMAEQLSAGGHGEGEAAETLDDLDADPAWVLAEHLPATGAGAVVVIVADKIVGDLQEDGAKAEVARATQGSLNVDAFALVAGGNQAGAAGDVV